MSTFVELRRKTAKAAQRIATATGVPEQVVHNVIMYAKTLTPPGQTDVIDRVVFIAQMSTRFGMSSKFLIDMIFDSLNIKGTRFVRMEDYVQMLCIFYCDNINLKVDFTFMVYDIQKDGVIDHKEIQTLLLSSIIFAGEEESDDQVKELIDIVMAMADENADGVITLEEYRKYVQRNVLCLELLGRVLPLDSHTHAFFSILKSLQPHEISIQFKDERRFCLGDPSPPAETSQLYPIQMELP